MAQNVEAIFDASSAHKMHIVIANYKRYVCVCVFNYGGFWELLQY
jgi:hypothetical protein